MEQETGWRDVFERVLSLNIKKSATSHRGDVILVFALVTVPLSMAWLRYYYKERIEREKYMSLTRI